jgi:hypothetical protein
MTRSFNNLPPRNQSTANYTDEEIEGFMTGCLSWKLLSSTARNGFFNKGKCTDALNKTTKGGMFLGKPRNDTGEIGMRNNSLMALVSPKTKRQANFLLKNMKKVVRNNGIQSIAGALTVNALSKPKQSGDKLS